MLDDSRAPFLIGERRSIRLLNRLHWDCPALHTLLCIDSDAIYTEPEPVGEMMRRELRDHVGQQMFDAISGGGWKSSYTGEWLSREVMEQYADNVGVKLAPFIGPATRVLEIGCGSGISLCRLAPRFGQPVANTEVLILEGDEPVPVGVVGELCAGGDGLARGYLNDPELTRHRFVPHPFAPGWRLYRTGDLARWQAERDIRLAAPGGQRQVATDIFVVKSFYGYTFARVLPVWIG